MKPMCVCGENPGLSLFMWLTWQTYYSILTCLWKELLWYIRGVFRGKCSLFVFRTLVLWWILGGVQQSTSMTLVCFYFSAVFSPEVKRTAYEMEISCLTIQRWFLCIILLYFLLFSRIIEEIKSMFRVITLITNFLFIILVSLRKEEHQNHGKSTDFPAIIAINKMFFSF